MNEDHRATAAAWHTGESSRLHAYATTGDVQPGLDAEIEHHLAMVDHATAMNAVDRIYERERLLGLLGHVEPLLAADRARAVGHQHARLAAVWWQQDNLDRRAPGDVAATARRTLRWIDEVGDPKALGISPGWDEIDDPREIGDAAGLRETPDDDTAAHGRWETALGSVCEAYTDAFAEVFWAAVAEASRAELARTGPASAATPPRVSEHHLAYARLAGAEAALAAASELDLDSRDASAVTTGAWHGFEPPAPSAMTAASRSRVPRSGAGAADAVPVGGASAATQSAIHGDVTGAWLSGRDTVWVTALWAKAMRTLGHDPLAQRLYAVCGDRLGDLVEALDAARSGLATPAQVDHPEPPLLRRAGDRSPVPAGWEVVPVGRNDHGEDVEILYDPRRYDVLVAHRRDDSAHPRPDALGDDPVTAALAASGWEQHTAIGQARVWVRHHDTARPVAVDRDTAGTRAHAHGDDTAHSGRQAVAGTGGPGAGSAASMRAALARLDRRVSAGESPRPEVDTPGRGVEP